LRRIERNLSEKSVLSPVFARIFQVFEKMAYTILIYSHEKPPKGHFSLIKQFLLIKLTEKAKFREANCNFCSLAVKALL
jgi:hypothetical protein